MPKIIYDNDAHSAARALFLENGKGAALDSTPPRISMLSTELLATIFEAGCVSIKDGHLSKPPFPITVSHVSRYWRSVAHHTHRLWTSVTLDSGRRHNLEVCAGYIRRTGALPLELSIRLWEPTSLYRRSSENLDMAVSVCSLIFPHIDRCRSLRVWTDWSAGLLYMSQNMPTRASLLETLEIYLEVSEAGLAMGGTTEPSRLFTGGTPALRSVLLKGVNTQHSCLAPLFTVTTLQIHTPISSLRCDGKAWGELATLSHLVINNADFDWVALGSFELATLTTLHLNYVPNLVDLLISLDAPLLSLLYMDPVVDDEMRTIISTPSLRAKYPRLRSLTLGLFADASISGDMWAEFMDVFPTVEHFTLLRHEPKTLLHSLSSSPGAWPALRKLSLPEGRRACDLASVLSRRFADDCPIREVQLSSLIVQSLGEDALKEARSIAEVEECNVCTTLEGDGYVVKWLEGNERDEDEDEDDAQYAEGNLTTSA
ncbi:hypothetical protein FIBSPDRAFT_1039007 [Athelia psychrophila]|uniref:Uncharacterized protein n=1 Tax=Athelia psychrophila TaxID=1759441 RepID=A0A166SEI6_9AGAM|nr:hypothetical protein FIBSPDRAFT_1039007 [Fibularhizoctonia sp. CBS 109695]